MERTMRTYVHRAKRLILGLSIGLGAGAALLAGCNDASSDASTTQMPSPTASEATSAQAGLQGDAGSSDESTTVAVQGFLFRPEVIEVPVGTTVTWANTDQILHTVTSGEPDAATGLFDGQMDGAGTSFSRTFDAPGRFLYFCSRHLHMQGEVIVR